MSPRRVLAPAVALVATLALLAGETSPATSAPDSVSTQAAAAKPKGGGGKTKGKVVWDATTYGPGGLVAAHGKLRGKGKRKVKLEVKVPGGWEAFGKTKTSRKGEFAISGSLNWFGTHKVRVSTVGKRPFRKATKVTGAAPYVTRGNPADHVPIYTLGAKPVRIAPNPCKSVKYLVNADDVGPVGLEMVQQAAAQVSYATGVKLQYAGPTSLIPLHTGSKKLPGGATLVVGWGDEAEIPEFVTQNAVGLTDYMDVRYARDGRGKKIATVRTAGIALDTNYWNSGIYGLNFQGSRPPFGKVVLHEFGHFFGLDHVTPDDEVMHPGSIAPYPDGTYIGRYESGDFQGLFETTLGSGCHTLIGRRGRESARTAVPAPLVPAYVG